MLDPAWAKVLFIGLIVTPWTKGLGRYYQNLIIANTTEELIKAGFLSDFRVFGPASPDLSECASATATMPRATSARR